MSDSDLRARAYEFAQEVIVLDTHIDVPYRLEAQNVKDDVSERTDGGDFDYPRAVEGGLDGAFMSIYVPASYEDNGAKDFAESLIQMMEGIVSDNSDKFALAASSFDVRRNKEAERFSILFGMENGSPVEGSLDNLRYFYDRGIRYITLCHSKDNHISDSSYDESRTWGGLSPFGREVVSEMNRLGMMIDISHVSDDAAEQILEVTQVPVIASHSSARHFTPGWERNMSDALIRKLADNGGVIQINFGSSFLSGEIRDNYNRVRETLRERLKSDGLDRANDEHRDSIDAIRDELWKENQPRFATIGDVVDHIDHVVNLVGVDYVGFGSDYDGVGDSLPEGLKDVSNYRDLIHELLVRGYSEEDVEKMSSGNLLRVMEAVENFATQAQ